MKNILLVIVSLILCVSFSRCVQSNPEVQINEKIKDSDMIGSYVISRGLDKNNDFGYKVILTGIYEGDSISFIRISMIINGGFTFNHSKIRTGNKVLFKHEDGIIEEFNIKTIQENIPFELKVLVLEDISVECFKKMLNKENIINKIRIETEAGLFNSEDKHLTKWLNICLKQLYGEYGEIKSEWLYEDW